MGDIEIFQKYLREGNLDGVRNSLQSSFLEVIVDDESKWRPIHWACTSGHLKIVKLLIEHAVNLECEDGNEWRPIHWACWKGHFEIVKLLTDNNCYLDCKTQLGSTPLDLARIGKHDKCAKLIQGIIENNKKLFDCVKRNDDATLHKLYKPQILFIQEYDTHLSMLDVAIQTKSDKIVKYFLDRNVDDEEFRYLPNGLSRLMQEVKVFEL